MSSGRGDPSHIVLVIVLVLVLDFLAPFRLALLKSRTSTSTITSTIEELRRSPGFDGWMVFVPEGQHDSSQARSAWTAVWTMPICGPKWPKKHRCHTGHGAVPSLPG